MINIRPVSDLRNKFTDIEELVKEGEPVYLTIKWLWFYGGFEYREL